MEICPLTGQKINLQMPFDGQMMFFYETPITGKVKMTDVALMSASSLSLEEKQILVGICRNRNIKKEEPLTITDAFMQKLKNQEIPHGFKERAKHLLKYLYDYGGKEYKSHNLNSETDSPITYSSKDEFERIIRYLKDEDWIEYDKETPTKQCVFYHGLRINKKGIAKIENELNDVAELVTVINELNGTIDEVENNLRNIVVEILVKEIGIEDFESLLTGEVKQQVKRRIEQHIEKHPNQTKDDFRPLTKSIQFCDIEHLKKTILKNEYWGYFETIFKDKLKVEKYFDQFSEIRNVVKHNREMTNLILHEGKAAIEWFVMVIG